MGKGLRHGQLKGIEGYGDKAPESHLLVVGGKGQLSWGLFPTSGKKRKVRAPFWHLLFSQCFQFKNNPYAKETYVGGGVLNFVTLSPHPRFPPSYLVSL